MATISAPPSAGMFSIPRTSTRNQFRYSGRSSGSRTWSVSSSSNPNVVDLVVPGQPAAQELNRQLGLFITVSAEDMPCDLTDELEQFVDRLVPACWRAGGRRWDSRVGRCGFDPARGSPSWLDRFAPGHRLGPARAGSGWLDRFGPVSLDSDGGGRRLWPGSTASKDLTRRYPVDRQPSAETIRRTAPRSTRSAAATRSRSSSPLRQRASANESNACSVVCFGSKPSCSRIRTVSTPRP